MSLTDSGKVLIRLEPLIFRLDMPEGGYGMGFFISQDFALTAFHNLYPSVLEDAAVKLSATFGAETIELLWELRGEKDRKWQQEYDVAVLRAVRPLPAAPQEKFLYLDAACKGLDRDLKWIDRKVVAVGIPSDEDRMVPVAGRTRSGNPLVDVTRIVGRRTAGTIPAALYFSADANEVNAAHGMSGSPVYDEGRRGIVGVVVAARAGFYATELVHVVEHWPAGRDCFRNLRPKRNFIAEYPRPATLGRALGAAALVVLVTLIFWFRSYLFAPKDLKVELVRDSTKRTETVEDQFSVAKGEKLRLLITSAAGGYLYVVDREIARDGALRQPYLAFPTLSTGAGRNKVTRGMVVSFPDPSDRSQTIEAKPSQPNDSNYAGEMLTVLLYDRQLPIDHLEAQPIPLTSEQFPDDGDRLLFSSEAPTPKAAKTIKLVVLRTSQTPHSQVKR